MKTNAPISLNICMASAGLFCGNLIPLLQLCNKTSYTGSDLICFAIGITSIVLAIYTGISSFTYKDDAKKLLAEIRDRNKHNQVLPNQ